MRINGLDWLSYVLVIIGGLNWGLVGLFNFNLVDELFGVQSAISTIIYVLVGLSAVYLVFTASKLAHHSQNHMTAH